MNQNQNEPMKPKRPWWVQIISMGIGFAIGWFLYEIIF